MNRRRYLQIPVFVLLLFILCMNTTMEVKAKEINYKKEFPAYLQKAVSEQKIDLNGDGKLSLKEVNAVTSLTLNKGENQSGFYSLDSITVFKNLKKLHLNCRVKSLTPLYSLKKLSVLKLDEEALVLKAETDFSKISNLKTLISKKQVFTGVIDLRNNKKLKILELPSETYSYSAPTRIYDEIKVYLPDHVVNVSGIANSKYILKICNENKKIITNMFIRKPSVSGKKEMEKWVSRHTCTPKVYVLKGKSYVLNKLNLVSANNGKSLQKALKGENVSWKCLSKDAQIQKGRVRFSKAGSYTLMGYAGKKRYLVNLYVIESKFGGISKNCAEVRIFSSAKGIPVYIKDPGIITELYSKLNTGNFKYKFSCCGESVGEQYSITFYDAKGKNIDSVSVMKKYIGKDDLYYTNTATDLWTYTGGIYNKNISEAAMEQDARS